MITTNGTFVTCRIRDGNQVIVATVKLMTLSQPLGILDLAANIFQGNQDRNQKLRMFSLKQ